RCSRWRRSCAAHCGKPPPRPVEAQNPPRLDLWLGRALVRRVDFARHPPRYFPQKNRQRWEDLMPISRRTLLKSSAAATAALSLDWTRAQAQAETVRIGVIYHLTSPFLARGC